MYVYRGTSGDLVSIRVLRACWGVFYAKVRHVGLYQSACACATLSDQRVPVQNNLLGVTVGLRVTYRLSHARKLEVAESPWAHRRSGAQF